MIKVNVVGDEFITSIVVKGHSNSAPYGQDLICAATSAILIGGANAFTKLGYSLNVKVDEGYMSIKEIPSDISAQAVAKTIVEQLETVARENDLYIKLIFTTK